MSNIRKTPPTASDGRNDTSELPPQSVSQEAGAKSQKMTSRPESSTIPLQYSTTSAAPPTGKNGSHRMNTINSSGADDNHPKQPPPAQSMFNSLYDDSDGSDGRYVSLFSPPSQCWFSHRLWSSVSYSITIGRGN